MTEENVKNILEIIIDKLDGKEFIWRLEGSVNLKVQGIDVSIRDLDITTDNEGIAVFRDTLKQYIVNDFFSEKINGLSLICDIHGFEIEINSYGDREKDMFDKRKKIMWQGLRIPILPLEYAKIFYELIDRKEKVELISNYLLNNPK